MRSLRDCSGRELTWKQKHRLFAPVYELYDGQEVIATLTFRSAFGSLAAAECVDGCWTFKRTGFFRTRVTVRKCGADADIAVFKNATWSRGGTIEQAGGPSFQASTNLWNSRCDIATSAGETLIHYESRFGIVHPKRVVVVQPAAAAWEESPWLTLFGMYLIRMLQSDDVAAAAAGAAASG